MPDPTAKPRWYRLTPDRLILSLLVAEVLLFLSNWLRWPAWHKGYAVLTCVACATAVTVMLLAWFVVALVFRRRFQFGIRSLLALPLIVALPCSWLMVETQKAAKQASAKESFRRFAGGAEYDYKIAGSATSSPAPARLRRLFREDLFASVELVCLACEKRFTDADMEHVGLLPRLKVLRLYNSKITDSGMQHLALLTDLEDLSITRTHIGDAGLEHVRGLTRLYRLNLYETDVTDAGLADLGEQSELRELCLGKTKVTDAGLQHVERLKQLTKLQLGGTAVSTEGVKRLQEALPNCTIER